MMPRKRVASELARSSRWSLPQGLDGFDRDVPIGIELGLCRGTYLKGRLSARRAIRHHAAGFLLLSAVTATSIPSASLIAERRRMAREVTRQSKAVPAGSLLALALGAAAFGAVAIGALAIGRLVVGRLVI